MSDCIDETYKTAKQICLVALERREYSALELRRKLQQRHIDSATIDEILAECAARDWQSDARFCENYVRHRANHGFGPVRIEQELRERGVADELVSLMLHESEHDWRAILHAVRVKKFGEAMPDDFKARAKQARFLTYRGFSHDMINLLFD